MDKDKSLNSALILSVLLHILFIFLLSWVAVSHSLPQTQPSSGGMISAVMINPQSLTNLQPTQATASATQQVKKIAKTAENNSKITSKASSVPTTNKPALIPEVTKSDSVVVTKVTSVAASKTTPLTKTTAAAISVPTPKANPAFPVVTKSQTAATAVTATSPDNSSTVMKQPKTKPTEQSNQTNVVMKMPNKVASTAPVSVKTPIVSQQPVASVKQIATDKQSQQAETKKATPVVPKLEKTTPVKAKPSVTPPSPVTVAITKPVVKSEQNSIKKPTVNEMKNTEPSAKSQVVPPSSAQVLPTSVVKASLPSQNTATDSSPSPSSAAKVSDETSKQTTLEQKSVTQLTQSKSDDQQLSQLFSSLTAAPPIEKTQQNMSSAQASQSLTNRSQSATSSSASQSELDAYNSALVNAIENQFKDPGLYRGKSCALHIKLASDGLVLSAEAVSGDAALCREALTAIRMAKIPAPFNQGVYDKFKNTTITFKPD